MRIDVGHIHEARDASGCRRGRLGCEISLARQARLAEVHLVVDHAGDQVAPVGINDVRRLVGGDARPDLFDSIATHKYIGVANLALVDQARVGNQQLVHGRDCMR